MSVIRDYSEIANKNKNIKDIDDLIFEKLDENAKNELEDNHHQEP